jgi:hypothetical protein
LRYLVPLVVLAALAGVGGYFLRPKAPPPRIDLSPPSNLAEDVRQVMKRKTVEMPAEPPVEEKVAGRNVQQVDRPAEGADAKTVRQQQPQDHESQKEKQRDRQQFDKRPADVSAKNWYSALRADLNACSQKPFVSRIYCNERARWRHCPGHWGTVDECPKAEAKQR